MRRRQLLASGMFAAIGLSAGELLTATPAVAETAPLKRRAAASTSPRGSAAGCRWW
jgi:hypothetical protein